MDSFTSKEYQKKLMAGKVIHTGLSDFIAITVTFKTKVTFFLGATGPSLRKVAKNSRVTRKLGRRCFLVARIVSYVVRIIHRGENIFYLRWRWRT